MSKTDFIINCLIKKDKNQWDHTFDPNTTQSLYILSVNQSWFVSSEPLKTDFHVPSK